MRRMFILILITGVLALPLSAQDDTEADDGIPANCESTSPYANPLLFPRYTNGTLALIDWSSGETARTLEQNSTAPNFWFVGWSPDCHYLTGGLGDGTRYTTIIWDAITGARMGTVEDAWNRPHFLTWSPRSDALVVQTRHGAFLWELTTGQRYPLTVDSFNGTSFFGVEWDYDTGTLRANMLSGSLVIFSLSTGRPVNITLADNQYPSSGGGYGYLESIVTAPDARAPYGCQVYQYPYDENGALPLGWLLNAFLVVSQGNLIVQDGFTRETIAILDTDFENAVRNGLTYGLLSPQCDMFFTLTYMDRVRYLREGVVIRMSDGARIHTVPNMPRLWTPDLRYCCQRNVWDATGRYLFAQSYDGAQIWDSVTDSTYYVTTPEESARYGFSVYGIMWDIPNGRAILNMLYSPQDRLIDLATGQPIS